jgi:hypothetical protein
MAKFSEVRGERLLRSEVKIETGEQLLNRYLHAIIT